RLGLVDFVTASPFLASDFSMPLTELRQEMGNSQIPLYATIEFGYAGKPHSEETLCAAAIGLWDCGADGIYLFNFPCWREYRLHPPWSWVHALVDPVRLRGRGLTFPLINQQNRVSGIDLDAPLPVTIPGGTSRELGLRLPAAAVSNDNFPHSGCMRLESTAGLNCIINGVTVELEKKFCPTNLQAGENIIVLSNTNSSPAIVTLAELELEYHVVPSLKLAESAMLFHVSVDGSDLNAGTKEEPFRTITRAIEAVRMARNTAGLAGHPAAIVIHGGTYRLAEPIVLGPDDNDIVFRADDGEEVVLSGGVPVTGFRPDVNGRWKATVPLRDFRQLYVRGERAIRARGRCPGDIIPYGNTDFIDAKAGFVFPDGAMADWGNQQDIELGFFNSWSHMICLVRRIYRDGDGRAVVEMQQPAFFLASRKEGVQARLPAYIENALELLDEPGEWYYNRAEGALYYLPRPSENMEVVTVVAPQLETLLRIEGTLARPVHNVTFIGITFAEATWCGPSRTGHVDVQSNFTIDAQALFARDGCIAKQHNEYIKSPANIVLRAARNCRFERCRFTRLGGAGVDLEHGSCGNVINQCEFFDISGSAVQIGDVRAEDHHPPDLHLVVRGNLITNCRVHRVGIEFKGSVGVFAGYTEGTVIACNEIHDLPYSGVSVGWGWGEEDAG
ncbi:MAG: right-handed parallel beta-helix repeat-containing protein, partial [Verrucomicrobiae bacterium]|nr:right-handed parallel beta-helix repeat-containing protein [Verrucomicrobiae bacterium]